MNYNMVFYERAQYSINEDPGIFADGLQTYKSDNVTISFKNGTVRTYDVIALVADDLSGVSSGEDYYNAFCNATVKMEYWGVPVPNLSISPVSSTATATTTKKVTAATNMAVKDATGPRALFPPAVFTSTSGDAAGYFLGKEYPGVAVLSLSSFVSNSQVSSFQSTVAKFLAACTAQGKTHIIIDLMANGGGTVALGYDTFKQVCDCLISTVSCKSY